MHKGWGEMPTCVPFPLPQDPRFLGFTICLFMSFLGNVCLQRTETHPVQLKQKGNLLEEHLVCVTPPSSRNQGLDGLPSTLSGP